MLGADAVKGVSAPRSRQGYLEQALHTRRLFRQCGYWSNDIRLAVAIYEVRMFNEYGNPGADGGGRRGDGLAHRRTSADADDTHCRIQRSHLLSQIFKTNAHASTRQRFHSPLANDTGPLEFMDFGVTREHCVPNHDHARALRLENHGVQVGAVVHNFAG